MAEKWFATAPLVNDNVAFSVGDEVHRHFTAAQLEALEARGEASRVAPLEIKAAYALTPLSYHTAPGTEFRRGDRIDRVIPARLVAQIVARGEASYERPDDVQPVFAAAAVAYQPHGSGPTFSAGARLDGNVPDDVLAAWLADGRATYDEEAAR